MGKEAMQGEAWSEGLDVFGHLLVDLPDGAFLLAIVKGMDAEVGLKKRHSQAPDIYLLVVATLIFP